MQLEEGLLEEPQPLLLEVLTALEHLCHLFHVLGVVSVQVAQGRLILLSLSLNVLSAVLNLLLEPPDLKRRNVTSQSYTNSSQPSPGTAGSGSRVHQVLLRQHSRIFKYKFFGSTFQGINFSFQGFFIWRKLIF